MTQDELKQLVSYDPETGIFLRLKKTSNRINMDDASGWKDAYGYIELTLAGKRCKAHRMAWLYMTGKMPIGEIDHINRVKNDNRFCNLRDVARLENELKKGIQKNNTSGYKGVSFQKQSGKWEAYVCSQRKKKVLACLQLQNLRRKQEKTTTSRRTHEQRSYATGAGGVGRHTSRQYDANG